MRRLFFESPTVGREPPAIISALRTIHRRVLLPEAAQLHTSVQDALDHPSVEGREDGTEEFGSLRPPQEEEALLGILR